jgi:hypothetical protein
VTDEGISSDSESEPDEDSVAADDNSNVNASGDKFDQDQNSLGVLVIHPCI